MYYQRVHQGLPLQQPPIQQQLSPNSPIQQQQFNPVCSHLAAVNSPYHVIAHLPFRLHPKYQYLLPGAPDPLSKFRAMAGTGGNVTTGSSGTEYRFFVKPEHLVHMPDLSVERAYTLQKRTNPKRPDKIDDKSTTTTTNATAASVEVPRPVHTFSVESVETEASIVATQLLSDSDDKPMFIRVFKATADCQLKGEERVQLFRNLRALPEKAIISCMSDVARFIELGFSFEQVWSTLKDESMGKYTNGNMALSKEDEERILSKLLLL